MEQSVADLSTAPRVRPITTEQYLKFRSPKGYRDELIEGEIVVSPEAKPLHHDVALNLFRLLDAAAEAHFHVGMRINFRMPKQHSMPSPDVWVIPQDLWLDALDNDAYPQGSPMLAVEVVSPSNTKRRVEQKTALYLDGGTVEVWCVYPRKEEIIARGREGEARYTNLPGIALPLPAPLSGKLLVSEIFRRKSRSAAIIHSELK